MYTKKLGSDASGLVDIVHFDMSPVITRQGKHATTNWLQGKKYPAALNDLDLLEIIMKDIFKLWYGKAFESIVRYYADNKITKDNQEFYVIRGEIRVRK
ncbi:hypothetical protein KY348_07730 [Candidatus Woesearchaeota archaeon]|nr:hypothetical protein [Candidatus Woesearchaeota archaeon]